jgi:hypothetical protein
MSQQTFVPTGAYSGRAGEGFGVVCGTPVVCAP